MRTQQITISIISTTMISIFLYRFGWNAVLLFRASSQLVTLVEQRQTARNHLTQQLTEDLEMMIPLGLVCQSWFLTHICFHL